MHNEGDIVLHCVRAQKKRRVMSLTHKTFLYFTSAKVSTCYLSDSSQVNKLAWNLFLFDVQLVSSIVQIDCKRKGSYLQCFLGKRTQKTTQIFVWKFGHLGLISSFLTTVWRGSFPLRKNFTKKNYLNKQVLVKNYSIFIRTSQVTWPVLRNSLLRISFNSDFNIKQQEINMKQELSSNINMSVVSKRITYEPQRSLINEYNVIQPQKVNI